MSKHIKIDKFHTISIRKHIIYKVNPEEITLKQLLIEYMSICSMKYKTEEDIVSLMEDLYDYSFQIKSDHNGCYEIITFTANAIDPKYVEDSNYTMDKIYNAFIDLSTPYIVDSSCALEEFNKAKKHLKAKIEKRNKYPGRKATKNALHYFFKDTLRDYDSQGDLNDLKDITAYDLYNFYLKIKDYEHITISCGDCNLKYEMEDSITPKYDTNFLERAVLRKRRIHTYAKTQQTYLRVIYDTNIFVGNPLLQALVLYNYALGNSNYSHLFRVIREQYGLCYAIDSLVYGSSGILMIAAEIQKKDLDLVLKKIDECIDTILDSMDLDKIKRLFILTRKSAYDSPEGYLTDEFQRNALPLFYEDNYDERINEIKIEDIKKAKDMLNRACFVYTYGGDIDE